MTFIINPFVFGGGTSMIVSGAGTSAINGTYTKTGTHNGKDYYNLTGTDPLLSSIRWYSVGLLWQIRGSGAVQEYSSSYDSTNDVATPDLVTTWAVYNGASPVPTVTQG